MIKPTELTDADTMDISTDMPEPEPTPEFVCQESGCNRELFYGGRGRKPKYCDEHKPSRSKGTGTGRRSSKDVDVAVTTLDQAYSLIAMGLFGIGARQASTILTTAADEQKAANRAFLEMDPALAKRIASLGRTGGMYAFITSQVMMMMPVVTTAYAEMTLKARAKSEGASATYDDLPTMMGAGVPSV